MSGRYLFGLPMLSFEVGGKNIEFLVDTGFNGELMLPVSVIKELCLEQIGRAEYFTADGGVVEAGVYAATLALFGELVEVDVVATDSDVSIVGMALLSDYRLVLEQRKGVLDVEQ